jgi:hypothetical protein
MEQPASLAASRQDLGERGVDARADYPDPRRATVAPANAGAGKPRTGMLLGLGGLLFGLAMVGVVLWQQNTAPVSPPVATPAPAPSAATPPVATAPAVPAPAAPPAIAPTPAPAPPSSAPPPAPEFVIRKSAAFGGPGGVAFDDTDGNPKRLPISAIHVTVSQNPANANQKVIGRLMAYWGDRPGPVHGIGPSNVAAAPAQFAADETITKVFVFYMAVTWPGNEKPVWVTGLQVRTNKGVYNFGDTTGRPNECVAQPGETIVAFFGRSGSYIDQLGCVFAKPR